MRFKLNEERAVETRNEICLWRLFITREIRKLERKEKLRRDCQRLMAIPIELSRLFKSQRERNFGWKIAKEICRTRKLKKKERRKLQTIVDYLNSEIAQRTVMWTSNDDVLGDIPWNVLIAPANNRRWSQERRRLPLKSRASNKTELLRASSAQVRRKIRNLLKFNRNGFVLFVKQ